MIFHRSSQTIDLFFLLFLRFWQPWWEHFCHSHRTPWPELAHIPGEVGGGGEGEWRGRPASQDGFTSENSSTFTLHVETSILAPQECPASPVQRRLPPGGTAPRSLTKTEKRRRTKEEDLKRHEGVWKSLLLLHLPFLQDCYWTRLACFHKPYINHSLTVHNPCSWQWGCRGHVEVSGSAAPHLSVRGQATFLTEPNDGGSHKVRIGLGILGLINNIRTNM